MPQDVSAAQPAAELRACAHQRMAELRAAELRAAEPGALSTPSWERRALEAEARTKVAEAELCAAGTGGMNERDLHSRQHWPRTEVVTPTATLMNVCDETFGGFRE